MSLDTLFTFVLASAILSFAPGPDNIFVLTQSALHGKRAGIFITLGLCTGLIVHTLAVALGLAAIFMVSALAFNILKFIGAGYLIYLAWQALRASNTDLKAEPKTTQASALSSSVLYRRGIIMNLTNPKVAIFFLAFLPQFTNPDAGSLSLQLIFLGGLFIVVALLVFSLIAVLAGFIAVWFKNSPTAQLVMNRIAALVFIGLAARLIMINR